MYQIIRFFKSGNRLVIDEGLTLEQAQEHCSSPDTEGEDWFDGYESED